MQKVLRLTALCAALIVNAPTFAADTPQPATTAAKPGGNPVMPKSDMIDALTALAKEIKDTVGAGKGNPIPHLDKLAAHQYSDDTRAKLHKVFGNSEPMTIARSAAAPGMVAYTMAVPAHSYTDANATTTEWTGLNLNMLLDKDGKSMLSKGAWPSFSISDKNMGMTASDMRVNGAQRRNEHNIWLGKVEVNIGQIAFKPADRAGGAVLEDLSFTTNAVQRGTGVDIGYDTRIAAIKAGGEQLDALRFALRMTNLDMRMLEKMSDGFAQVGSPGKGDAQQIARMMAQFKAMGLSMSRRGSALEIEEISAGLRGNRLVIKGRLSMAPATEADLASMAAFSKKLTARLSVRLPVVLVTDVAKAFMANEAKTKGKAMTADELAQGAQTLTDVVVGKLLNGGMARLDNGVLVSLIELKGGKLTCNGKPVALPIPKAGPNKPAADAAR